MSEVARYVKQSNVPTAVNLIKPEDRTVETILKMYNERIEDLDSHRADRLKEYCQFIKTAREKAGKDDWFNWMHQGIMTVANKSTVDQRNIAYLIGIYKRWLKSGFGAFYNEEEDKLKDFFTLTFGVDLSPAAEKLFSELVQDYGITYATIAVATSKAQVETDLSLKYVKQCREYLLQNCKKLGERSDRVNDEKDEKYNNGGYGSSFSPSAPLSTSVGSRTSRFEL